MPAEVQQAAYIKGSDIKDQLLVARALPDGQAIHITIRIRRVIVPLVCYVLEQNLNVPLDSDRLLRLLGVSVKLSGFYYAVYMLEQVQHKPDHVLLITKRLYKQTAQHFETTSGCVERNLRTLVRACWRQPDHTLLDQIAGRPLRKPPTNMQFLGMLSAYLRK